MMLIQFYWFLNIFKMTYEAIFISNKNLKYSIQGEEGYSDVTSVFGEEKLYFSILVKMNLSDIKIFLQTASNEMLLRDLSCRCYSKHLRITINIFQSCHINIKKI